jgi:hypothetical protein
MFCGSESVRLSLNQLICSSVRLSANILFTIGIFRKTPWVSPIMAPQFWPPHRPLAQSLIVAITFLQQINGQNYAEECFPDYGSCSQQVIVPLFEATGCVCPGGPSSCLCLDDSYLFNVMKDVGACCSLTEVNNTAETSADNCNADGTPMSLSVAELIDAGKTAVSSSCPIAALAALKSSSTSTQSPSTTAVSSACEYSFCY